MGCGRDEDVRDVTSHVGCICEVVRTIRRVQDIREDVDCEDCKTDCFMTPLGSLVSPARQRVNTRVFMLLDKKGDPFKAMFKRRGRGTGDANQRDCVTCYSIFFRVENVFDNCCATLQVLEPRRRGGGRLDLFKNGRLDLDAVCEAEEFVATGTCLTVDLKCFCGIQCVKDTYIECLED